MVDIISSTILMHRFMFDLFPLSASFGSKGYHMCSKNICLTWPLYYVQMCPVLLLLKSLCTNSFCLVRDKCLFVRENLVQEPGIQWHEIELQMQQPIVIRIKLRAHWLQCFKRNDSTENNGEKSKAQCLQQTVFSSLVRMRMKKALVSACISFDMNWVNRVVNCVQVRQMT